MTRSPLARLGACTLALCIGLVGAGLGPVAADPNEKLEELEKKADKAAEKSEQLAASRAEVLSRIAVLDKRRQRAETRVERLDTRLSELDRRIVARETDLEAAQQRLALVSDELEGILLRLSERTEVFSDRAVAAYKAGPTAFIDAVLSSQSFTDLVDTTVYYEAALDTDASLVNEIQVLRDETQIRRSMIEEKRAEISAAKRDLERSRSELAVVRAQHAEVLSARAAAVADKKSLLAQVERKKAYWESLEAQLQREADEKRAIIAAAAQATAGAAAPAVGNPSGDLLWPANGPLTSPYGYRTHPIFGDTRLHTGIDIGAGYGSAVYAADNGVVIYVGTMSGYGSVIIVDHGGGLSTTYNHLSGFSVSSGQSVSRGSTIGAVGCSGYCTGPHLHFEVRVGGDPVDPMPYFQ